MKPLIGITPGIGTDPENKSRRFTLNPSYVAAVEAAGGVPILIPPQEGNIEQLLDILGGVILVGGGDIRPDRYGDDTVHPKTYGIDDERDTFEFALTKAALARDMPLLGICRGVQVLNVALGGTLIQDIPDQHGTTIVHSQKEDEIPSSEPAHGVTVEPGSLLETVYGCAALQTNSFHHQALLEVASPLQVAARAEDGIIEAVWHTEASWVLGVQWHPEMMFRAHHEHIRPFQALVAAATAAASRAARSVAD